MKTRLTVSAALVAFLIIPAMAQTPIQPAAWDNQPEATRTDAAHVLTLSEPTGSHTAASGSMPTRGMTMRQVEQSLGAPMVRRAPVGNPPITRWEYEGFIVYFEYRHVIHSVNKTNR